MSNYRQHSLYKKFDIEEVFTAVFNIYKNNFLVLYLTSFVGILIVQTVVFQTGVMDVYRDFDYYEVERFAAGILKQMMMIMSVTILVYALIYALITNYIYKKDIDPKMSIGDIYSEAASKYFIHILFFLVLATITILVGTMVGVIALIVGAFVAFAYLGTVFIIGNGIVVVEEKNAFDAFGRTFSLAHKDFWSTLGAVVLFVIILAIIGVIISALVAIPFVIYLFGNISNISDFGEMMNPANFEIGFWVIAVNAIIGAFTFPITPILGFVLFYRLKYKEDELNGNVTIEEESEIQ